MASPVSNSGTTDSSSPFRPMSTPAWGTGAEGSLRDWTPNTDPSLLKTQSHKSKVENTVNDKFSKPASGHSLFRAHLEKRRLAEIQRLGLNETPSKPVRDTDPASSHEQPSSASALTTPGNIAQWPLGSANTPQLTPTSGPSPQGIALITSKPRSGCAQAPNLIQPRRAPNWTPAPLIPLSSFPSPRPQSPSYPAPVPSSPWPILSNISQGIGANDHIMSSADLPTTVRDPSVFNSVDHDRTANTPTIHYDNERICHAQGPLVTTQNPMVGTWPIQSSLVTAPPQVPLAGATAAMAPLNPWSWNPGPPPQEEPVCGHGLLTQQQLLLGLQALPDVSQSFNHPRMGYGPVPPATASNNTAIARPGSALAPFNYHLYRVREQSSYYHPMNCRSANRELTPEESADLMLMGFSPNYRGDPKLPRNQSADIPVDENCSLFLVGLAPNLTTHELLAGIRDVGRVFATHINPPAPERGHAFSAAKLVFFDREGAGKRNPASLSLSHPGDIPNDTLQPSPLTISSSNQLTERFYSRFAATGFQTSHHPHLRARVTWNRVRSAEEDKGGRRSRVLLISGPPEIVEPHRLCAYLDTKMVYQLDEIIHKGQSPDGARVLLEIRFGSFRCQAEAARMALMREFRDAGVLCEYGKLLSNYCFSAFFLFPFPGFAF
ncbi:hypothetical protein VTJ49DRAFT_217 [Mycothermus thermophilus]|uniref:RRM domain-containing protein n=1 Tax=Humicola insolens TaxID=85995 RepID=A0ABR3VG46_HUMIN